MLTTSSGRTVSSFGVRSENNRAFEALMNVRVIGYRSDGVKNNRLKKSTLEGG